MSWSGGAGGSHLYNFHKIVKLINLIKLPFWNELFILTGRIYIYIQCIQKCTCIIKFTDLLFS
jgi:hypothetical protein